MSVVKVRYCSKLQRDICLWYEGFGNPTDPPVLLIMGLNGQGIAWDDEFCQMLAAKGPFYVIRFDNRDVGLSTKIENVTQPWMVLLALPEWAAYYLGEKLPYTLEDMADDAVALLDTLNLPKAHLVGVSMGGMIAQLVAIHHPDRCLSLTSMFSSTSGSGLPDHPLWMRLQFMKKPKSSAISDLIEFGVASLKNTCCYGAPFDEEYVRKKITAATTRMVYPPGLVRQAAAVVRAQNREPLLQKLRLPVLVVHGECDHLIPYAHGVRTSQIIPGAILETLPNTAHYMFPQQFDSLTSKIASFQQNATKR